MVLYLGLEGARDADTSKLELHDPENGVREASSVLNPAAPATTAAVASSSTNGPPIVSPAAGGADVEVLARLLQRALLDSPNGKDTHATTLAALDQLLPRSSAAPAASTLASTKLLAAPAKLPPPQASPRRSSESLTNNKASSSAEASSLPSSSDIDWVSLALRNDIKPQQPGSAGPTPAGLPAAGLVTQKVTLADRFKQAQRGLLLSLDSQSFRVATFLAALLEVLALPTLVAFNDDESSCLGDGSGWAVVTLVLDLVLWTNALRVFFRSMAYVQRLLPLSSSKTMKDSKKDKLARRRRLLLIASASSWLLCDVLALLPWGGGNCINGGHLSRLWFAGHARSLALRTLNIAFPTYGGPLKNRRAAMQGLILICQALLALHWYACLQYLVGNAIVAAVDSGGHEGGWLSTYDNATSSSATPWVKEAQLLQRPVWARYLRCFDRGLLVVVGEGVHGDTDAEIALSLIGLLIGTGLVAMLTSTVVEIVRSMTVFESEVRMRVGRVRDFLRSSGLPRELEGRCVRHLLHFMLERRGTLTTDQDALLRELSIPLRTEVEQARLTGLLNDILSVAAFAMDDDEQKPGSSKEVLSALRKNFYSALAAHLKPAVFSPGDRLIKQGDTQSSDGYFIGVGIVRVYVQKKHSFGKQLLVAERGRGALIGEGSLIGTATRGAAATVVARTYVEAYRLARSDYETVIERFPALKVAVTKVDEKRRADKNWAALKDRGGMRRVSALLAKGGAVARRMSSAGSSTKEMMRKAGAPACVSHEEDGEVKQARAVASLVVDMMRPANKASAPGPAASDQAGYEA